MMKKLLAMGLIALCTISFGFAQKKTEEKILIPFRKGDKWGFADTKKKIRIKPIFDKVTPFRSTNEYDPEKGTYVAEGTINQKEVLIAEDGSYLEKKDMPDYGNGFPRRGEMVAVDAGYDYPPPSQCTEKPYSDANLSFPNGKHGFKAQYNPRYIGLVEASFAPVYSEFIKAIQEYKYGILRLKENQKLGVIDTEGNILLPFEYDEIMYLEEKNNFQVKKGYNIGLVDMQNNIIVPIKYHQIIHIYGATYRNQIFLVSEGGYMGAINSKQEILVPTAYDVLRECYADNEGEKLCFLATKAGKKGFIDYQNKEILPIEYRNIWNVYDVGKKKITYKISTYNQANRVELQGIFDLESQKIIIPCKYKEIGEFAAYKQGVYLSLVVNEQGVSFYIDQAGTEYYAK